MEADGEMNTFDHLMATESSNKRAHTDSESSSTSEQNSAKKPNTEQTHKAPQPVQHRLVFISSTEVNISKVNPLKLDNFFAEHVGPVHKIQLMLDSIKIVCTSSQANLLKRVKSVCGYKVKVEIKDFTLIGSKGIIHGVHEEIEECSFLNSDPNIVKVIRLQKFSKEVGTKVPTRSVILHFTSTTLPGRVFLGFMSFRVNLYIPPPTRCFKCQRFGHVADMCRSSVRCPRCGERHSFDECSAEKHLCCLCGGSHSAAYKGCEKYKEANQIQQVRLQNNLSYADALRTVKYPASTDPPNQAHGILPGPSSVAPSIVPDMSTKPVIPAINPLESDEFIEATQEISPQIYGRVTAFVAKVVSVAQDPTFWKQPRISRINTMVDFANKIFETSLDPSHILKMYMT